MFPVWVWPETLVICGDEVRKPYRYTTVRWHMRDFWQFPYYFNLQILIIISDYSSCSDFCNHCFSPFSRKRQQQTPIQSWFLLFNIWAKTFFFSSHSNLVILYLKKSYVYVWFLATNVFFMYFNYILQWTNSLRCFILCYTVCLFCPIRLKQGFLMVILVIF